MCSLQHDGRPLVQPAQFFGPLQGYQPTLPAPPSRTLRVPAQPWALALASDLRSHLAVCFLDHGRLFAADGPSTSPYAANALLPMSVDQYAKGLVHCDQTLGEEIRDKIERLKWSLWHGNLYKALYKIDDIESLIYNFEETYPKFKQLLKALEEFRTYITHNRHLIPNYGERYRNGEAIATGFVESTVNQVVSKRFCKKQQMQWSKRGAHLLLQTRVKTLNRELGSV